MAEARVLEHQSPSAHGHPFIRLLLFSCTEGACPVRDPSTGTVSIAAMRARAARVRESRMLRLRGAIPISHAQWAHGPLAVALAWAALGQHDLVLALAHPRPSKTPGCLRPSGSPGGVRETH